MPGKCHVCVAAITTCINLNQTQLFLVVCGVSVVDYEMAVVEANDVIAGSTDTIRRYIVKLQKVDNPYSIHASATSSWSWIQAQRIAVGGHMD